MEGAAGWGWRRFGGTVGGGVGAVGRRLRCGAVWLAAGEVLGVGEGTVLLLWALCPPEAAGGVHLWVGLRVVVKVSRQWWRWGRGGAATGSVGGR